MPCWILVIIIFLTDRRPFLEYWLIEIWVLHNIRPISYFARSPVWDSQKLLSNNSHGDIIYREAWKYSGVIPELSQSDKTLEQCLGETDKKMMGMEVIARRLHNMALDLFIPRKLRRLGTPISSHDPLACAASTSFRVGATRSWRVRLEAPSSTVPSMLITICAPASTCLTMAQSP